MSTLARHLVLDDGHHGLVIARPADNEATICCDVEVGFRPLVWGTAVDGGPLRGTRH